MINYIKLEKKRRKHQIQGVHDGEHKEKQQTKTAEKTKLNGHS